MTLDQLHRARDIGAFALSAVLIAAAGWSAGRYSAPAEVETRTEYRSEVRTKTVEVVKWRTARAVDTRTTTTPVLLPAPDGGVVLATRTETTTAERDTASGGTETRTEVSSSSSGETSQRVTQQAAWRVGAQVGASLHAPALPITGSLVLGASLERRIVGGVSAGVWANTVGAAGASLSLEF
jgi:hypothetical protein